MKTFDLTMPIDERTPSFPGAPRQEIAQTATVEKDGWSEKRISINTHFSTHIDAPVHMNKNGKTLDDYPPETFIGQAIALDARGQKLHKLNIDTVQKGDMVFLCTAHSNNLYKENYFSSAPAISPEIAQSLIEKEIRMIGIDSWSPDHEPFAVHKLFFEKDILIIENLMNLVPLIGKRFECIVAPLKITKGDGAPCRVFAKVD